ncbi:MAG TPA: BlaI/MecI/CopY family transcriptional regulator [Vicinamibacterales bacterium]|jgi:predicted transcriptional regulator
MRSTARNGSAPPSRDRHREISGRPRVASSTADASTDRARAFVYRAAVPPRSLAARSVRQLIDRFWSGSAEQFLAGTVDEKLLTPAQIRRLATRINDRK